MRFKYFIAVFLVALVLYACTEKSPTGQQPVDIPYRIEAEQAALFYSGQLEPPLELTKQIGRELAIIRDTWLDSIPEVRIKFLLPWRVSHVHMRFDDTAYANIVDSQNAAWGSLCDALNVTYYTFLPPEFRWVGITSNRQMNSLRLGEYYVHFPGINYIHTSEIPHDYPPHFVRFDDFGTSKYYFRTWCMPYVLHTLHYFMVENDSARFMGRFASCYEAYDSLIDAWPHGWDSLYWFMTAYEDSVWEHRPRWVDTAWHHISRLEHSPQFDWSRPE